MHVLVTCKYKKIRIKNNREKVETSKFVYWKFNLPTRARNSEATDMIQTEFKLVWDFIAVLVTSKFDEDPIKKMNELAWRHNFPIISLWEIFRCSRAANYLISGPIWPKVKLVRDFMHVLVTCKYKKNLIKNNRAKVEASFFPIISQWGLSVAIETKKPICPKTLCNLSPTLMMLHIKFDQRWPTGLRDIQVSSELWQNDRIPEGQGKSSIAPLFQSRAIIKPSLVLVYSHLVSKDPFIYQHTGYLWW